MRALTALLPLLLLAAHAPPATRVAAQRIGSETPLAAAPNATRATVASTVELVAAIEEGVAHIVITEHLDLRGVGRSRDGNGEMQLLRPRPTTRSIRVRWPSLSSTVHVHLFCTTALHGCFEQLHVHAYGSVHGCCA